MRATSRFTARHLTWLPARPSPRGQRGARLESQLLVARAGNSRHVHAPDQQCDRAAETDEGQGAFILASIPNAICRPKGATGHQQILGVGRES
jgi:hypothetical protein